VTGSRGPKGFFSAALRGLAAAFSPAGRGARLVVFSYHQVFDSPDPLRPGEPDTRGFAADVATIASIFRVLTVGEAARRMADGTLPARAACITFDDGYANNHRLAAPILEAAGVPATFFVAGGAVDAGIMWNDLIIEAVARRRGEAVLLDGADLRAADDADAGAFANRIVQRFKYESFEDRAGIAARIFTETTEQAESPRLMMTRAMVAELAKRGFEIGGHTMNHPILEKIGDDEARAEIEGCSAWIEEITGVRPESFAYPNGRPTTDFGPRHEAMVAQAGYRCAVSTEWSIADARSSLYRIPRVGPWWRQDRGLLLGLLRLYVGNRLR
jgi:peptidoglycan/xylan/chitin deacetylase (PgdA/CDA1 family)